MKVYVQTTKELSCLLNAEKIKVWNEDFLQVLDKDDNIIGLFDLGCILFIYKTEPNKN